MTLPVLVARTESYAHVLATKEICLVIFWHFQFLMQSNTAVKQEWAGKLVAWETSHNHRADYFQRLYPLKFKFYGMLVTGLHLIIHQLQYQQSKAKST